MWAFTLKAHTADEALESMDRAEDMDDYLSNEGAWRYQIGDLLVFIFDDYSMIYLLGEMHHWAWDVFTEMAEEHEQTLPTQSGVEKLIGQNLY